MEESIGESNLSAVALKSEISENVSPATEDEREDVKLGTCLLCDEPLDPSVKAVTVVKRKGISNIRRVSRRRNDGKSLKLIKVTELVVHESCRSTYSRESSIQAAFKKAEKERQKIRARRQRGREFDFSKDCFICSTTYTKQDNRRVSRQATIDYIIEQLKSYEKNEFNLEISARLSQLRSKTDDYYVDNEVHYHKRCYVKFYKYKTSNVKGHRISDQNSGFLCFVINHLLENSEECQFSLNDIIKLHSAESGRVDYPKLHQIEQQLKSHFGDEIAIYKVKRDRIICYKANEGDVLESAWYSNRCNNEEEERMRIVNMAAHIVLQDIRAKKFDVTNYDSSSNFLQDAADDVPQTLKSFLDVVVKTHKDTGDENQDWHEWENKIVSLAHAVMSCARPRSFCSRILFGLSCMIRTKFASRGLVDCLSNVGFSASHSDAAKLESFEQALASDFDNFLSTNNIDVYADLDYPADNDVNVDIAKYLEISTIVKT